MKINYLQRPFALLLMSAIMFGACSKSNNNGLDPEQNVKSKYFIAAKGQTEDYEYLITADDLTTGAVSIAGNGKEVRSGYTWVFPNQSTGIGFIYQKGSPGVGLGVTIDASGKVIQKGPEFLVESRFTTYGVCNGLAITSVGGQAVPNDDTKKQAIFNIVNPNKGNEKTTKNYITTNMTGNGEFYTFSGIVDAGNGEFLTAMVPSKNIPTTGGGSSTGDSDYLDSVWVAKFDTNLNLKKIYKDNRLSFAAGQIRSQYYSMIANDDKGNTYVFSGAHKEKTTKKAGVIRINKGASDFDKNFYWDIQAVSDNYIFMKAWHISGDYFLLNFYNKQGSTVFTDGYTKYAVVNVVNKSFKWLTQGFPGANEIKSTANIYAADGKAFIPVTTVSGKPAIYVIDPVTATATRGLEVDANAINGIGKLTIDLD